MVTTLLLDGEMDEKAFEIRLQLHDGHDQIMEDLDMEVAFTGSGWERIPMVFPIAFPPEGEPGQ